MKNNSVRFPSDSPDACSRAAERKGFTPGRTAFFAAAGLALGMLLVQSCSKATAGPNGGDIVMLDDGKTNAEIMANSATGEAMVHTWNQALNSPLPIEARPLTLGTDASSVRLDPQPVPGDPPGYCSQFYGRANWLRGASTQRGWLSNGGNGSDRQHFQMNRCWDSGRTHGRMWSEMGGRGPGMSGRGPGMDQGGHEGMRR